MAKTDYTALDSAILTALRNGPATFAALFSGAVHEEALLHAELHQARNPGLPKWKRKPADRFLDARLQALRKSGMVRHENRTGWNFIPLTADQEHHMDHKTEQDAGLLEQAATMLEEHAEEQRARGNDSAAEGAACSAHAIRRLAPALLRAGRGCLAQIEEPSQPADDVREAFARRYSSDPADPMCAADLAIYSAGWHDARAGAAPAAVAPHITEPYTLAEIKAKIASHDYSAELLLQHAMLLLESAAVAGPADVRDALREASSVISSINHGRAHELTVNDEKVFWQRQEWVDWALREVLPRIDAALAAPALEAPPGVAGRTMPRNDDERAAAQFFADNPGAALLAWPLYLARDKAPALEAPAAPAGEVVYRWQALDFSGYCYGSNPPEDLPARCNLTPFYRQPDAYRAALHEISATGNLTATDQQFARHLQQIARDALEAAPQVPAPAQAEPVSDEPPFLQRLRVEQRELQERYEKLEAFLTTLAFSMLDNDDADLLVKQSIQQHSLLQTLNQRIHSATEKHLRSKNHE